VKALSIYNGLYDTLIKEFNTDSIEFCLKQIGLKELTEDIIKFHDINPWQRGGSETYYASSKVTT